MPWFFPLLKNFQKMKWFFIIFQIYWGRFLFFQNLYKLMGKESTCNVGSLGHAPGGGNDNPLQYFCLENLMNRGALVGYSPFSKESDTTEPLHEFKHILYILCLVAQLCRTLCNPMGCSPPGASVCGDSLGKNIRVGCHALLQGIFWTQGLNPGLPHHRWFLYYPSHQGSP